MSRIRDIAFAQIVSDFPAAAVPTDHAADPVLIVIRRSATLALAIDELCRFLGIRVVPVQDTVGIAQTLHDLRPIGVLAITDEVDCAVYDLLMAVAGFDADLPVLMITGDHASVCGAVRSVHRLWQLSDLVHFTRGVDTRDLIDFLFRAGRRSDTARMMPI
jgi:hypothetical protein